MTILWVFTHDYNHREVAEQEFELARQDYEIARAKLEVRDAGSRQVFFAAAARRCAASAALGAAEGSGA